MNIIRKIIKWFLITSIALIVIYLMIKLVAWTCTLPITIWWLDLVGNIFGLESTFAKYIVAMLIENIGFIVVVFLVGFFTFSKRKE